MGQRRQADGVDAQRWYPSAFALADGYHRLAAAYKAQRETFPCDVRIGSKEDAQWFALGANNRHGLRPSSFDYERIVARAFEHPQAKGKSDREIARHLGISAPTIAKYKVSVNAFTDTIAVTRNGKQYRRLCKYL